MSLHTTLFIELLESKLETKDDLKFDSFFMLIEEYLNLEIDLDNATKETIKLLQRAREDYLEDILFEIDNSPYLKYRNFYTDDLKVIKAMLQNCNLDYEMIKIVFTTFHKKRTVNYFGNLNEMLEKNKRIDFEDIFKLVDNLLQEIIYHNFSYEKIRVIIKHSDNKNKVCKEIQNIYDESKDKKYPLCLINAEVPKELEDKEVLIVENIKLYKIFNEKWEFTNSQFAQLYKDSLEEYFLKKDNKSKYNFKGSLYIFETYNLNGADYQTRIRKAVRSLEVNLKGLMSRTGQRKKNIIHNTAFTFLEDSPTNYKRLNVSIGSSKYVSIHKNRSINDIEEFYKHYVISYYQENNNYTSFRTIYNLLDLIKNASEMTLENKLVILWSCIEKICVDLNMRSIINKVVTITSKSHLMYILKRDLNEIWQELVQYGYNEKIASLKNVGISQSGEINKYNPELLLTAIKEMKEAEKKVIIDENIILAAKIYVFQENVKDNQSIKEYLLKEKLLVQQNIRRIYRHRNILTHTHNQESFNLQYFTDLLEKYLNGLLSTIIHYTLRNPNVTIKDIIYSIDKTYDYYESEIISSNDYKKILKPHYLLL
ncbi:hypothetical protein [Lysinibacillus sp. IITD104]|uniref:hypothetical protein n=1 Tax=Lysinibacillus sp. IITD104 TaxID=3116650 RepID=UPI002FD57216